MGANLLRPPATRGAVRTHSRRQPWHAGNPSRTRNQEPPTRSQVVASYPLVDLAFFFPAEQRLVQLACRCPPPRCLPCWSLPIRRSGRGILGGALGFCCFLLALQCVQAGMCGLIYRRRTNGQRIGELVPLISVAPGLLCLTDCYKLFIFRC